MGTGALRTHVSGSARVLSKIERAEHQGFYDTELITIKQTRDSKMEESDVLTAESEKLIADIQQLAEEVASEQKEETLNAFIN